MEILVHVVVAQAALTPHTLAPPVRAQAHPRAMALHAVDLVVVAAVATRVALRGALEEIVAQNAAASVRLAPQSTKFLDL